MQFSSVFKQLLIITSVKLNTLSKEVGYDSSYLSRFSTGKLLPKGKNAPILFRKLSVYFSNQIRIHNLIDLVSKEFNMSGNLETLEDELYELLTLSYQGSIGTSDPENQINTSEILFTVDQLADYLLSHVDDELVVCENGTLISTLVSQLNISKKKYNFHLITSSCELKDLSTTQPNLEVSQVLIEDNIQFCLINQSLYLSITYFEPTRTFIVIQTYMTNAQLNFIKTYLSNLKSC